MTIRTTVNLADLNRHLVHLDSCVRNAPPRTHAKAKAVHDIMGEMCDEFMRQLRLMNLTAPNCDQIREVEAMMWGYIRTANPEFAAEAEGFGEHSEGPAGARVIAQAERDRDFLRAKGVV